MNARVRDYRLLWRAGMSHANPFASTIVRLGLPFLVLVAGAVQYATHGLGAAVVWGWRMLFIALLMVWAYRFVPGAVRLNRPANAQMVPRARRRLMELFCLVWFVAIAGFTLPSWFSDGSVLLLAWLVGLSLGSALAGAGHWAGTPAMFAVLIASVLAPDLSQQGRALLSHPAVLALGLLLSTGLAMTVARLVFPRAGERHWRMVARLDCLAEVAAGKPDNKLAGPQIRHWYASTLRRDSTGRDARRLVLHALGPTHHMDEVAKGLVMLSVAVFVLGTFIGWRAGEEVMIDMGWLIACSLLAVPFSASLRLSYLIGSSTGEQSLVRLAPLMPAAAPAFNRNLAQALLLHGAKGWALSAAAAVGVAALGGTAGGKLFDLACVCGLLLPMVAVPLRNYAVRKSSSLMPPIVLLLAAVWVSAAIGFTGKLLFDWPVLPLAAAASIACAAIAVAHGLRLMAAAPFAFPAGRVD